MVLSEWFVQFELSFAMGVSASIPNLIGFLSAFVVDFYDEGGFLLAFGVGFGFCVFSLVSAVFLTILDQ